MRNKNRRRVAGAAPGEPSINFYAQEQPALSAPDTAGSAPVLDVRFLGKIRPFSAHPSESMGNRLSRGTSTCHIEPGSSNGSFVSFAMPLPQRMAERRRFQMIETVSRLLGLGPAQAPRAPSVCP